tara:strand:- start:15844 stop:17214 length:1371 start_codon:yes stop_codon:yes gene_type:complete
MQSQDRELIKYALTSESSRTTCIKAWVRTKRESKNFAFLELNDGSCLANLQVIINDDKPGYDCLKDISTGAAVCVLGTLVESPGKGQKWELHADKLEVYGLSAPDYPLQKKGHSLEFLREIAHLRPRTNLFGAVFRIRNQLSYAVHQFFQERDFLYVHTPIITASDCEGAGELFRVSTAPLDKKYQAEKDFFGRQTYLTVSGQLEGELFATALSNVYTFGPTFRAENSNTARHAAEFWMIEPEMAFYDLQDNMQLAEDFVRYCVTYALEHAKQDLDFLQKFVDKNIYERLEFVAGQDFQRLSYTEAIEILGKAKQDFDYQIAYGSDLQTEHERYLCETHFKKPVILYNYPDTIKPFYMRRNDDGKTVAAMDVLVPGVGELVGGSQREERLDVLTENMEKHGLNRDEYFWYLDTRKYGSVPHSGFGLGFERLIMFITGVSNIRDVIPFPRTPKNCEF